MKFVIFAILVQFLSLIKKASMINKTSTPIEAPLGIATNPAMLEITSGIGVIMSPITGLFKKLIAKTNVSNSVKKSPNLPMTSASKNSCVKTSITKLSVPKYAVAVALYNVLLT